MSRPPDLDTMKISRAALAALACLAFASPSQAGDPPADAAELGRLLATRFEGDRSGACVQAAVIDGPRAARTVYCAGPRRDPPPAMDAPMEIGSITKTMTACLVADLVERGAWTLDDPIAQHLPEGTVVPRQGERQLRVRDLLTHSAGLPTLPPGVALAAPADPYARITEAQLLESLGRVQWQRPIGSQVQYSNFGMMLLSLAVARAQGGSLETALQERLFGPLQMQAHVGMPPGTRPAPGHLAGGHPTPPWTITPNLAGIGMVRASLADMERYARAMLGDGPAEVVKRLRATQQPLAHGLGMAWFRPVVQGRTLLLHDGATGGFASFIALDTERQRAVVLLSDTELTDLGGLSDVGLAALGLAVPVQAPRRPSPASPERLQAMAGDYTLGPLRLRLWVEGGQLMAQAPGQPAFALQHDSRGDFYPTTFSALLTPPAHTPGAPGAPGAPVTGFTWRQQGVATVARRAPIAPESAP